ncbi:MAG: hypothetical protein KDB02_04515 [Acidimicrobiales bacterium]|nr:hypothetical protein [Acidimicrobiales bacterium]
MSQLLLLTYVVTSSSVRRGLRRCHLDERGEGVISAALAVLIMAVLGAAMWVVFERMFNQTTADTEEKVTEIGR